MMTKAYGIGYERYFVEEDPESHEGHTEDSFNFWYQPGDAAVGDYYQNVFYLVNYESGKKIRLNINVVFVEKRNPVEIVMATNITLPAHNAEGTDFAATPYDLSNVLEVLDCDDAGKLTWVAYNNLYQLVKPADYDEMYGFYFTLNGYLLPEEFTGALFSVGYTDGEFHSLVMNPLSESEYTTAIVATYNGKGYRFNIKVTKDGDTGIRDIVPARSQNEGAIFNLSGQRIASPRKGLNIINGKKVLIK